MTKIQQDDKFIDRLDQIFFKTVEDLLSKNYTEKEIKRILESPDLMSMADIEEDVMRDMIEFEDEERLLKLSEEDEESQADLASYLAGTYNYDEFDNIPGFWKKFNKLGKKKIKRIYTPVANKVHKRIQKYK